MTTKTRAGMRKETILPFEKQFLRLGGKVLMRPVLWMAAFCVYVNVQLNDGWIAERLLSKASNNNEKITNTNYATRLPCCQSIKSKRERETIMVLYRTKKVLQHHESTKRRLGELSFIY